MKWILHFFIIFLAVPSFAQSKAESEVLKLSGDMFRWEVEGKIDSLANLFDEKFMVVSAAGEIQTRDQYLARLQSGNFVHNQIDVEETLATVANNTATVVGKGLFTVTVSGNKISLHLSYMEVYTKSEKGWKLLALHASRLAN